MHITKNIAAAAVACVVAVGCGGDTDSASGLTQAEEADLVLAAREAAAAESYLEVDQVRPRDVRVDGDCAAVVVLESQGPFTLTAFMRRSGERWSMAGYITGDVSLELAGDEQDCQR